MVTGEQDFTKQADSSRRKRWAGTHDRPLGM